MYNIMIGTPILRKNQNCELKIKQLYIEYRHRYNMSHTTYTITINGVKYRCIDLEKLEVELKKNNPNLHWGIRI